MICCSGSQVLPQSLRQKDAEDGDADGEVSETVEGWDDLLLQDDEDSEMDTDPD
jgi:hypothetical protein